MTENQRDSAARDGNTDAGRASHVYAPPTLEDLEREDDVDDYDLWETR